GTPHLVVDDAPTATRHYIESRLGADDLVIWDARSPAEYRGEKLFAARGGHIPGAVNFEWTAAMDPARALRIREDIAERLLALGIVPDKEIVTH
ncbi:rhodanese-like domain-containing protein, partial [Acinetobacter baumannii]